MCSRNCDRWCALHRYCTGIGQRVDGHPPAEPPGQGWNTLSAGHPAPPTLVLHADLVDLARACKLGHPAHLGELTEKPTWEVCTLPA